MPRVQVHNAWQGCSVLVEYLGAASTPVVLEIYQVTLGVRSLLASRSLVADVNGFAHWVYDASALAAGTELFVQGISA